MALLSLTWISACGSGGGAPGRAPIVQDATPDFFTFMPASGVSRGTIIESDSVSISGISTATSISIAGGEYSINGGAYESASGSITNGQSVQIRLTSSDEFDTEVSATLTIGGITGTFSVTTLSAPQVLIDVNANIRHSVGGVDTFDRAKFITVHSDATDHDWFGNNAQSLNEPNALPDLMQNFLGGNDVFLGRSTGGITWFLGEMDEDAARMGYVDETDATNTGNAIRSNFSNNPAARWVSSRLHAERAVNMIIGGQQHPFWPDGTMTRQGWALSQTDTLAEPFGTATGHYMGQYLSKFYRPAGTAQIGDDKPRLVEVMNEPVYDLVDTASAPASLDQIFEFHNAVAAEIRATNNDVLIGGYTAAFPVFDEDNFDRWRNRHKRFLDLAGASMDFVSIHLYDIAAIDRGAGVASEYRKGSYVEATFDMLDHYSTMLFGAPKPTVISEYGGRAHIWENDPWSPERDWYMLKSQNSLLMSFLERPDNILMAIPFVVIKAEWGRTTVPYPWRLMRQRFEAAGETGNDWVYTDLVKFYELWSDINGTRVDSFASDPDILVDAYVDGTDLYVVVNNLEFDDTTFALDVTGLSGNNIVSIEVRHLYADNGVAELARIPLTSLPESILLGGEATMIIRFKLDAAVTIDELSDETKHFAATMLQPISANSTVSFDVDGLTPGTHGEAILRLGIGRSHGLSLNPDVAINGTPVSVATDYRGYDQFHNGQGQPRFFGVLEIPVPWSAIASDNQVDVTFPDNGGYVSSVALQVFDQSVAVTRRSN